MTTKTHEIKLDGYGAHTTLAEDRPIMLLGTAESYGIETLHVVSGKSWEGLTVTATFNAPDGTSTDMLMSADGSITVPPEATAKSGSGKIVFTGVSNGIQRISCDLEYFVVAHSAINGVQSGGTAPSWFEQAATRFMPAGGSAGQVLTKLTDADFDAEWQDSQGGAGLEPLVGTTQTITPSQVLAAIKEGRDVALQYTDSYYGAFVFSAFNANEKLGIVVSNSILPQWDGLTGTLMGGIEGETWFFRATNTPTMSDIDTAVDEALTAAKASGEFDGADGITPTIGDNGNWFLGDVDTNKPSRGKSAYSYAQDGGYTGTEAEFAAKLAAEGLDKALFVVNVTQNSDGTLSADKTFDEIVQAYNEGKYNIVAHSGEGSSVFTIPFNATTDGAVLFCGILVEVVLVAIIITANNEIQEVSLPLATTTSKLPNPYPLRFTGAVSGTYDGSSAKTIEIPSGGGGSVPKPLTYDYMPEGYPTKAMGTVTVMEEQVVEFVPAGDNRPSIGSLTTTFTPVEGQTYIVNWDGTEHECICSLFNGRFLVLGNLSIIGAGDDTGEPFIYLNVPSMGSEFETFDTASSHTISVKKTGEIVTPMAEEFLPVASEDNYGAVKKSEVVSAYNFPRQVAHDQMVGAISAFKTGNASIVWVGKKVNDASYNSSADTISVTFAHEPLRIHTYENKDGFYYDNLGSTTYAELQGSLMRIGDDNAVCTILTTEGISGDKTLRVRAEKISIDDEFRGNAVVLRSSTDKSTKMFKITVDDSGTIAVTEVV